MKKLSTKSRNIMLLCLLTLLPATAAAQWNIGLQAGYTHNTLEIATGYAYDFNYQSAGGLTISVPVQYEFEDWFALQAELGFTQKNYELSRTVSTAVNIHSRTTNSYLQLPVLANFSFGGKVIRGFTNLGIYAGYWINSHVKGTDQEVFHPLTEGPHLYDYDENISFDNRRDNRFDLGLLAGVGVKVILNDMVQLLAEARFNYSLLDMQKNYMKELMPRHNNTFQFQIGCLITLK